MSLGTILLIVLVLLLIGALPSWPYSAAWGPAPAGILGVILIVVLILVLLGRLCRLRTQRLAYVQEGDVGFGPYRTNRRGGYSIKCG